MRDAGPSEELILRLWVRNQADVYRYVFALLPNPTDAQEVLQATCVALWRKAGDLDLDRPFLPVAFRFALLEVKKHREKNRRWASFLGDEALEQVAAERAESHDLLELRRQALDGCVGQLPPADRDLLDRHYRRQQTVPQIAGETGRNPHTLYKALQRVRRLLFDCVTSRVPAEDQV